MRVRPGLTGAKSWRQLQNSCGELVSVRPQDVVHRDSLRTDAAPQGLGTGAIGCIPTECQVMGYHLFYRAMHPYGMRGFAIGCLDRFRVDPPTKRIRDAQILLGGSLLRCLA